jgi:hypothetical protein
MSRSELLINVENIILYNKKELDVCSMNEKLQDYRKHYFDLLDRTEDPTSKDNKKR